MPYGLALVKGKQYITRKEHYNLVYETGKSWVTRNLVVKAVPNGLPLSRYGITVSKKVGSAVTRNRVKRRLREIMRSIALRPGWDIVVIARNTAATAEYTGLETSVTSTLNKAGIMAEEDEGNSSEIN